MISLTAGCLLFALVGVLPFGIDDRAGGADRARRPRRPARSLHALLVLTCAAKGKYRDRRCSACFLPVVAWFGAFRLARPGSLWAPAPRTTGAKLAQAERRADAVRRPLGPARRLAGQSRRRQPDGLDRMHRRRRRRVD